MGAAAPLKEPGGSASGDHVGVGVTWLRGGSSAEPPVRVGNRDLITDEHDPVVYVPSLRSRARGTVRREYAGVAGIWIAPLRARSGNPVSPSVSSARSRGRLLQLLGGSVAPKAHGSPNGRHGAALGRAGQDRAEEGSLTHPGPLSPWLWVFALGLRWTRSAEVQKIRSPHRRSLLRRLQGRSEGHRSSLHEAEGCGCLLP